MYRVLSIAAVAIGVAALVGLQAANADGAQLDSSAFSWKYEMDVDPTTENQDGIGGVDWALPFGAGSAGTVSGGILTLAEHPCIYRSSDAAGDVWANISFATGYTLEARVKPAEGTSEYNAAQFQSVAASGNSGFLRVKRVGQGWGVQAGVQVPLGTDVNNDGFHVFRLAQLPGEGTYSVWRDGVLLNDALTNGDSDSGGYSNFVSFGGLSGYVDMSQTQIDYVRLTSGAFEPVTSPPAVPGDFDNDGDVDGADFVAWQTHFPTASGATLADGDADADGDVDGADFVVWQTNFPFTPGPAASPIPEPGSIWLFAMGGVIALAQRKLRRR